MKFFFPFHLIFLLVFAAGAQQSSRNMTGFEEFPLTQGLLDTMASQNVFGAHSPVPAERIRLVRIRYYGFDEQLHTGALVVLDACSGSVTAIFQELLTRKFPLERVNLVTEYAGSDSLSMAANNTSAHNLRPVTGGTSYSLHAYGTAIDINPVQNPYIRIPCDDTLGIAIFQPASGIHYANRHQKKPGKPDRKGMAEEVVAVFAKNGFYIWGGYWNCPIDYQHFQLTRAMTELLVAMPADQAAVFFQKAVSYYNARSNAIEDALSTRFKSQKLHEVYLKDPDGFLKISEELH